METINKTEWYLILSQEYSKYDWIMRAMNESQLNELCSSIRSRLKQQYKVI
jgi:hypothetical protein